MLVLLELFQNRKGEISFHFIIWDHHEFDTRTREVHASKKSKGQILNKHGCKNPGQNPIKSKPVMQSKDHSPWSSEIQPSDARMKINAVCKSMNIIYPANRLTTKEAWPSQYIQRRHVIKPSILCTKHYDQIRCRRNILQNNNKKI